MLATVQVARTRARRVKMEIRVARGMGVGEDADGFIYSRTRSLGPLLTIRFH